MFFQAAIVSATAWIAVGEHRHVPQFSGHADEPVHDSSFADNSTANAGAQRQQDEVVHIAAGTDPFFAKSRRVRIVLENHGSAEVLLDFVAYGKLIESRQIV